MELILWMSRYLRLKSRMQVRASGGLGLGWASGMVGLGWVNGGVGLVWASGMAGLGRVRLG